MMFLKFIFLMLILLLCFSNILSSAADLPSHEVETLKEIGKTLGKDWDFSVDPCSGENGWMTPNATEGFENEVHCNCSYSNNTVCHIDKILLKSQNLSGTLPPQLDRLAFLQEIDLSRNYLNGTIPRRWSLMKLVIISLNGNRLTGPIPREFGNITTLEQLALEYNQLSGTIPPELGNLTRIKQILLTSNNFTGELPQTLAKLTTLEYFRISDNNFVGKIPKFIASWTNLENLIIQGSGLSGPIPSGIALLTKLTDLRISDLNGTEATFPPLSDITNLKTLILRSCNIIGELPPYLGAMTQLKEVLDVSFNKLSGEIPINFSTLSDTHYIYLTGNSLTGPVPDWMLEGHNNIDLSYNNFTFGNSGALNCTQGSNVNLFRSFSKSNTSTIVPCSTSYQCSIYRDYLYINCGGEEFDVDENMSYVDDDDQVNSGRPSLSFKRVDKMWGFSSTGHFLEDERPTRSNIWTNTSKLDVNNTEELYMTARLSPLSLTYYGICLINGNYTLKLHFAEIMFTDDKTYSSLGRRVFDVYVQGKLVLKDFNIEDEAGGVGKAIIKTFTVFVTENKLEIHFYWAGKGTNAIPYKGVYGPLISAISLDPDFKLKNGVPKGTVIGIVVAVLISILLVFAVLWWKGCLGCESRMDLDLKGLGSFTLREIKAATNNFDHANKIGEGGFGPVYKGILSDKSIIAVKQHSSKSNQGNREFVNEIGMISAINHPHLVKLYGCCVEGNQLLLVYEYMENNSLARALYGPEETQMKLDWPSRKKICVGIAKGLAYLHEESRLKIVHRDIKATNVLLDKNLNPKISDFGLAKLDEEDNTHISTRIAGTYGYMAPEYAMHGYLTDKADVYSFGIVALEIVSGKSNVIFRGKIKEDSLYLLDWAGELKEKGKLMELVDPRLGGEFNKEEVIDMINIALLCTNQSSAKRPAMSAVVSMLEGSMVIQQLVLDSSTFSAERTEHINSDETETLVSRDGIWMASSSSASDLYPVEFNTEYLQSQARF